MHWSTPSHCNTPSHSTHVRRRRPDAPQACLLSPLLKKITVFTCAGGEGLWLSIVAGTAVRPPGIIPPVRQIGHHYKKKVDNSLSITYQLPGPSTSRRCSHCSNRSTLVTLFSSLLASASASSLSETTFFHQFFGW